MLGSLQHRSLGRAVFTNLADRMDEVGEQAARSAHSFLAEAATAGWVRDCNVLHGVAPSSMEVFLRWEQALTAASWMWVSRSHGM